MIFIDALLYTIGIIVYIVGMAVYISNETTKNIEFHEGGFLNMGYTTHSNRTTTPKDVRMSLVWPILFIVVVIKSIIWLLNELLSFILLIFNYRYKETEIYRYIDKKFL